MTLSMTEWFWNAGLDGPIFPLISVPYRLTNSDQIQHDKPQGACFECWHKLQYLVKKLYILNGGICYNTGQGRTRVPRGRKTGSRAQPIVQDSTHAARQLLSYRAALAVTTSGLRRRPCGWRCVWRLQLLMRWGTCAIANSWPPRRWSIDDSNRRNSINSCRPATRRARAAENTKINNKSGGDGSPGPAALYSLPSTSGYCNSAPRDQHEFMTLSCCCCCCDYLILWRLL